MATIYIDNEPFEVREGQNLLTACLSLGFNIPYFCWHPALHSVGSCRVCAIKQYKDDKDTRGRIVMACATPVKDGVRISIEDPEAKLFRASMVEFLMLNHPHDCPVCDEGGECHLQDMTVMTGHVHRESRFKKRTYANQHLGPFLNHEMNRCIHCYRCVRFYRNYAGGRDFHVFGIHDALYFGRFKDGTLENPFSGNLVEVCPTGVFTDKTFKRHETRSWDLQTAPSVCVDCSVGCNTFPSERYGTLRRIRNRYHGEINGYFLCDRGRFGYEFVNSEERIREPLVRDPHLQGTGGTLTVTKAEALRRVQQALANADGIIGIGSPRASLEANFALRTLVGPEHFFSGMSQTDCRLVGKVIEVMQTGGVPPASLREIQTADAVLVLGEDLLNTAPMMALAVRQSVRQKPMAVVDRLHVPRWDDLATRLIVEDVEKGPLFVATPTATGLDDIATETFFDAPDNLARLGFAVAHQLSPEAPEPAGLSALTQAAASRIAEALRTADNPVIVSGTSCGSESLIHAAANTALALHQTNPNTRVSFVVPECNSLGLGLMAAGDVKDAFSQVRQGKADTAIIVENDLYRRAVTEQVSAFLAACTTVIVVDHLDGECASRAHIVFPAGTFADADGTLINNEGRGQRFFQVIGPTENVQESWRWVRDMVVAWEKTDGASWERLDDVTNAMAESLPALEKVTEIAPSAAFRAGGMKIPRDSSRYSGRTGMRANITVLEPKPPEDPDSALAFSMEGYAGQPPAALVTRFWAPGWNSVQAVNKFQSEIGGPLRGGDPGLRLIGPDESASTSYFSTIPEAFQPRTEEWLVVTLYHIFGSEELSVRSPGIAELAPTAYVGLNPEDAERLRVREGTDVELAVENASLSLTAKLISSLPVGVAGVPNGLPGIGYLELPAWGTIRPGKGQRR